MRFQGAEGVDPTRDATERRVGAGQRVHFEALVAVGETGGGAGFEAESVDVSPEGMRLRTAYLPEIGRTLLCRFEQGGAEFFAEGEVIWCEEQGRGGEFGIRFLTVDGEGAERLRLMCEPEAAASDPKEKSVATGARVRLHIEGLGSPMKARVRDHAGGEVRVGSNLEFLRVGRSLDLEDVDQQSKQGMTIDHVSVEVDPTTNIPQLVVSLRYPGDVRPEAHAASSKPVSKTLSSAREEEPEPFVADGSLDDPSAPVIAPAPKAKPKAEVASAAADDGHDDAPESEGAEEDESAPNRVTAGLEGAGKKAALAGAAMAKKVGPALSAAGSRMKGAAAGAMALLRAKREAKAVDKSAAPRRTTAPPPSGALTSEGRRLVRGDGPVEAAEAPAPAKPKSARRAAIIGSVVGILCVAGVVGATRLSSTEAPAGIEQAATQSATLPDLNAAAPAAPALDLNGGPVVANVPLFGATPLSTTEAVPPPDAPTAVTIDDGAAGEEAAMGEGDGEEEPGVGDETALTEWGSGTVKSPVVLKLKMDDRIESINGAKGAMGFTISLPGRRSLSAARDLARKDKRIAAVDVVNNAYGSEVTVRFKDGVPPYMAKVNGNRLEIAIGTDGKPSTKSKGKVAQKTTDKKKSSVKSDSKPSTKSTPKKATKKKTTSKSH